jgi:hypothetical protein
MIPSLRSAFNSNFKPEKYVKLLRQLEERCGVPIGFRVSETPVFVPENLVGRMAESGKELIRQLVENPEYRQRSEASIPAEFRAPNESAHPMFIQVDFGLVRDAQGALQPKLVELQAFPSLYGYQTVLAQTYIDTYGLDRGAFAQDGGLKFYLGGLDDASYRALLRKAVVGECDPENVILMEVDPEEQKTLPDFRVTENILGIRTVDITRIQKSGRGLCWEHGGKRVPIRRIYNRAIVDELERKGVKLGFDFRDELDVEWAGHPNWYFRISKFSIPYLKHETVPRTWFLDQMERVPEDLENFALKPLYSFAGLGVIIGPTKADIDAVPAERRGQYILQERLHFTPVIETPFGETKMEVRVMYIWVDELTPVLTILRTGRGLMMGVDHNKNMEWVGASAGLIVPELAVGD